MDSTRVEILAGAVPFLENVFNALNSLNCSVGNYYLDHICYRTKTYEEYLELKSVFSESDELLSENMHNGREIAVFRLNIPIVFSSREIEVFELPAPKKDQGYESGYEHIEFVINNSLRSLVESNTHLNFNLKNIDKEENPSVKLKLSCGSVKFHEIALESLF